MWQSPLATDSALVPFVDFSTNPIIICVNDTVVFRDRSTSTLTSREWQFPDASPSVSTEVNPKVVFNSPGRKRVIFYGWNGSNIGHRELVVEVVENTNCAINATGSILHSTFGSYYQWYLDTVLVGSTTSNAFRANTSGYYHVVVTNANGCISKSEEVYVDVSGLSLLENGGACSLFPNPASEQLFLGIEGGFTGTYQYEIRNLIGQVIQKGNMNLYASTTKYPIALNNLSSGAYLFSLLQNGKHLYHQQFQVEP
jgi:PKD repeat protein